MMCGHARPSVHDGPPGPRQDPPGAPCAGKGPERARAVRGLQPARDGQEHAALRQAALPLQHLCAPTNLWRPEDPGLNRGHGVAADPLEEHDLADTRPDLVKEMQAKYEEYAKTAVAKNDEHGICPPAPPGGWPSSCAANKDLGVRG